MVVSDTCTFCGCTARAEVAEANEKVRVAQNRLAVSERQVRFLIKDLGNKDKTIYELFDERRALRARVAELEARLAFRDKVPGPFCDACSGWEQMAWEAEQKTSASAGAAQHPTTKERCAFDGGLVNRCDEDRCVQSGECQIRKGRTVPRQENAP